MADQLMIMMMLNRIYGWLSLTLFLYYFQYFLPDMFLELISHYTTNSYTGSKSDWSSNYKTYCSWPKKTTKPCSRSDFYCIIIWLSCNGHMNFAERTHPYLW